MTVRQMLLEAIGQMEHALAAARDAALRPDAERAGALLCRLAVELDAARQRVEDLASIVRAAGREHERKGD